MCLGQIDKWNFKSKYKAIAWILIAFISFVLIWAFLLHQRPPFPPATTLPTEPLRFTIPVLPSEVYGNYYIDLACEKGSVFKDRIVRGDMLVCYSNTKLPDDLTNEKVNIGVLTYLPFDNAHCGEAIDDEDAKLFSGYYNDITVNSGEAKFAIRVPDVEKFALCARLSNVTYMKCPDCTQLRYWYASSTTDAMIDENSQKIQLFLALLGIFSAVKVLSDLWDKKDARVQRSAKPRKSRRGR